MKCYLLPRVTKTVNRYFRVKIIHANHHYYKYIWIFVAF